MIQQLRIYEIFDASADAFHARFRDHCMRIMARYAVHRGASSAPAAASSAARSAAAASGP